MRRKQRKRIAWADLLELGTPLRPTPPIARLPQNEDDKPLRAFGSFTAYNKLHPFVIKCAHAFGMLPRELERRLGWTAYHQDLARYNIVDLMRIRRILDLHYAQILTLRRELELIEERARQEQLK